MELGWIPDVKAVAPMFGVVASACSNGRMGTHTTKPGCPSCMALKAKTCWCTYIHTYIYIYHHMQSYTHTYIHMCMNLCMYVYIHMYPHFLLLYHILLEWRLAKFSWLKLQRLLAARMDGFLFHINCVAVSGSLVLLLLVVPRKRRGTHHQPLPYVFGIPATHIFCHGS